MVDHLQAMASRTASHIAVKAHLDSMNSGGGDSSGGGGDYGVFSRTIPGLLAVFPWLSFKDPILVIAEGLEARIGRWMPKSGAGLALSLGNISIAYGSQKPPYKGIGF